VRLATPHDILNTYVIVDRCALSSRFTLFHTTQQVSTDVHRCPRMPTFEGFWHKFCKGVNTVGSYLGNKKIYRMYIYLGVPLGAGRVM